MKKYILILLSFVLILALLPALSIYEFSVGLSLGTFLIIVSD